MNSLISIEKLIEEQNKKLLDQFLEKTWEKVWADNKKFNYSDLRLYKTVDKIKSLINFGVNFERKNILDIGCGNGTTLLYLNKNYHLKEAVGIDISEVTINKLKSLFINDPVLKFYIGDHRDLNIIEKDRFDIVMSWGVIEHFDEYLLALSEIRRVLKKDGLLILIQPHLYSFGIIQEYFLRIMGKWKYGKQKNFSCFYYKKTLLNLGFREIKYRTKAPYNDMRITRFFDIQFKKIFNFWGHYLFIIAKK